MTSGWLDRICLQVTEVGKQLTPRHRRDPRVFAPHALEILLSLISAYRRLYHTHLIYCNAYLLQGHFSAAQPRLRQSGKGKLDLPMIQVSFWQVLTKLQAIIFYAVQFKWAKWMGHRLCITLHFSEVNADLVHWKRDRSTAFGFSRMSCNNYQ